MGSVKPYAWYFVPHPAQFRAASCEPMDPGVANRASNFDQLQASSFKFPFTRASAPSSGSSAMIVLAILFGWAILLHGGWFEAVYGSPALRGMGSVLTDSHLHQLYPGLRRLEQRRMARRAPSLLSNRFRVLSRDSRFAAFPRDVPCWRIRIHHVLPRSRAAGIERQQGCAQSGPPAPGAAFQNEGALKDASEPGEGLRSLSIPAPNFLHPQPGFSGCRESRGAPIPVRLGCRHEARRDFPRG